MTESRGRACGVSVLGMWGCIRLMGWACGEHVGSVAALAWSGGGLAHLVGWLAGLRHRPCIHYFHAISLEHPWSNLFH
jgi:hypothetical protein